MTVYFIDAGPGDPNLLTLRAAELIARCPMLLYPGARIARALLARARPDARLVDTSTMTLEDGLGVLASACAAGKDVGCLQSADALALRSDALRRLQALGIPCEMVPGVSAYSAAAAALGQALTLRDTSPCAIYARVDGDVGQAPRQQERLRRLAEHRAALYLSVETALLGRAVRELEASYGADCPVALVHRPSCPEQQIVHGTLATISERVRAAGICAQACLIVGLPLRADAPSRAPEATAAAQQRVRKATRPLRRGAS